MKIVAPADPAPSSAPLLPFLDRPAALLWLWSLPVAVMLALNGQTYSVIGGNMDAAEREAAIVLGTAGLVNLALSLVAFLFSRDMAARRHARWAGWVEKLLPIAVNTAYLWLVVDHADGAIPRSVQTWIYPVERFLWNQFAFAMPALFLGVARLACSIPVTRRRRSMVVSWAAAAAAPVLVYLAVQVFIHARNPGPITMIGVATLFVACGLALFIALVRAVVLSLLAAQEWSAAARQIAVLIIALCLPIAGLTLNGTIPFPADFHAIEVYVLTVANAAVMLLAGFLRARWPRANFCLLCATLPFGLYFFLVFLPFAPLAVVAIIAAGAGFLILTPTLLFVLQLFFVGQAYREIRAGGRKGSAWVAIGGLCFLVLPGFFITRGLLDRRALNQALDHAFTPRVTDAGVRYAGSLAALERALVSYQEYRDGAYYPLLSDFYHGLVFDHLVLPSEKITEIERIFFGAQGPASKAAREHATRGRGNGLGRGGRFRAVPVPRTVEVDSLKLTARTDGPGAHVLTMALHLRNTGSADAEYSTPLPLPAGVFISGLRLQINGQLVPGRVFEKKTAEWVYRMIRDSERRDPALLVYDTPSQASLRVFPVAAAQPSVVEIDFLVPMRIALPDAAELPRDPQRVLRTLATAMPGRATEGPEGRYLAADNSVRQLPAPQRETYLHLLVDRSAEQGFRGAWPDAVRTLSTLFPEVKRARVTLVNFDVVTLQPALTPLAQLAALDPAEFDRRVPRGGGCAIDLARAHAMRLHREQDLDVGYADAPPPRPLFVWLKREADKPSIAWRVSEAWEDLDPGCGVQVVGEDGKSAVLREEVGARRVLLRCGHSVRALSDDGGARFAALGSPGLDSWSPDLGRWVPLSGLTVDSTSDRWTEGARLQLRERNSARAPTGRLADRGALIQASRASGVLSPQAGYIVVENAAQWRMLELGEKQKLGQNEALSFQETPAPPAVWAAGLFALWLWVRSAKTGRWNFRFLRI